MSEPWDQRAEARAALLRVVQGFGPSVLGQPDLLEGLLNDELPESPREIAILIEAARRDLATRLAERLRQGISVSAAASMTAAEVTARSAMDAAGARWAAEVFAAALGHQLPDLATTEREQETTEWEGGSGEHVTVKPPEERATLRPDEQVEIKPVPVPVTGAAQVQGFAFAAAACLGLGAVLQFFTGLASGLHQANADTGWKLAWTLAVLLIVIFTGSAVGLARTKSATAFALALGASLPAIAFGGFVALDLPIFAPDHLQEDLLRTTILAWMAAMVAVAILAFAALRRSKTIGRYRADPVVVLTTAAGIAFALSFTLDQVKYRDGSGDFESLFGGVTSIEAFLGVVFVLLVAALPVLTGWLSAGSDARPGLLFGWLLGGLAWLIFETPLGPAEAPAPGSYLAWVLWLAVLAGTAVIAFRGQPARSVT